MPTNVQETSPIFAYRPVVMGRHNNDPTVVHSSIALLQERFKQLERVKVMREERELLGGFAPLIEAEGPVARTEQQPKWFLHTELVRPSRPLSAPPQPLRLDTCNRYDRPEFQALETSLSMGFRHSGGRPSGSLQYRNCVSENADVDTSLHLFCNIATSEKQSSSSLSGDKIPL